VVDQHQETTFSSPHRKLQLVAHSSLHGALITTNYRPPLQQAVGTNNKLHVNMGGNVASGV